MSDLESRRRAEDVDDASDEVQDEKSPLSPSPSFCRRQWLKLDKLKPYSTRIKMVALFILAAIVMMAHDRVNVELRKRSHGTAFGLDKAGLQILTNFLGNMFAFSTKVLLSAVVGLAFLQVFWLRMRSKEHKIEVIDSAMSSRTSPLGIGALKAWRSMFLLVLISALGIANVQILLLATGSMQVRFAAVPGKCQFQNVNLTNANFGVVTPNFTSRNLTYTNPEAQVKGYVTQVVMFNTFLTPSVTEFDVQNYTLQFNAPGLNCTDITSAVSSIEFLPPPAVTIPVWNTVYQLGSAGSSINFTTATRDLKFASDGTTLIPADNEQVVQCIFYNVTYDVAINLTDFGLFQSAVTGKTLNSPLVVGSTTGLVNGELEFDALADTFGRTLNGTGSYNPNTFDFTPGSPIIVYSQFAENVAGVPFSLGNGDMTVAIPDLMDAVSVSLLADILNTEPDEKPLTTLFEQPCSKQALVFHYQRARLLISYGVGLLYTAICIVVAWVAIRKNGTEETMDFSRIIKAVVHPRLYEHREMLADETTHLQVGNDGSGEFHIKVPSSKDL